MIDRVAAKLGRRLIEVPVGSSGLWKGFWMARLVLAGERRGFILRRDGSVWSTDKDGLIWAC
jgi:phosphoglucomutase